MVGARHSRPHGPWPISRTHTSSPPHTTGARQRVLGTCARAPLPSSHPSAHSSHTHSLSRTLHSSHANSRSHIHSHTLVSSHVTHTCLHTHTVTHTLIPTHMCVHTHTPLIALPSVGPPSSSLTTVLPTAEEEGGVPLEKEASAYGRTGLSGGGDPGSGAQETCLCSGFLM